MTSNLDRYKKDLGLLISKGELVHTLMQIEFCLEEVKLHFQKKYGAKTDAIIEKLKGEASLMVAYQGWYSEAKVLIKQLMPERLSDFAGHYEKPKSRKNITFENYRIEDALQGLSVTQTRGEQERKLVGPEGALPQLRQQQAILKAVEARFESSLFDIRQLMQADLFDSELDAAQELAKHRFGRAAGALTGVVLERHLAQACDNHGVAITKKDPHISDLNDLLKQAGVIDIPQWRSIQYLADLRNLCDHNKKREPTEREIDELIAGAKKVTKTLF